MKKRFMFMTYVWRMWALIATLALVIGGSHTAVAQTPSEGQSFLQQVDGATDAIADGAEQVENNTAGQFLSEFIGNLDDAIEKGGDLGELAENADDIGKAAKAFKVLDLALKVIKFGNLSKETVQAWYAGDRPGFIKAFNAEVLEAVKLVAGLGGGVAGGVAAGALLGSVVPGAGTVLGAVVGAAGGLVGGAIAEWATEEMYEKYLEQYVEREAGELYDKYRQNQSGGQSPLPSGDDTLVPVTPGEGTRTKTVPRFDPLEI